VHQFGVGDLDPGSAWALFTRMNEQLSAGEYFSVSRIRQAQAGAPQGALTAGRGS
jgi:hypothetical protein